MRERRRWYRCPRLHPRTDRISAIGQPRTPAPATTTRGDPVSPGPSDIDTRSRPADDRSRSRRSRRARGASFRRRGRDLQYTGSEAERDRRRELELLFDLHGDAVFRCAAFAGDPSAAEDVTVEVFRDLWLSPYELDHADGGARLRLVVDCVSRACRDAPPNGDVADRSRGLTALALVLFAECTYRQAASAMAVSEADVLRRLDGVLLRFGRHLERSGE